MGQNEAHGLSFVSDFIWIFPIWVNGNTDSRKWATPWKRGLLSCEQLSQGAIPPSVWSALSSQPYHLGDAVGVPLTEHLQPKGPPPWLPGGGVPFLSQFSSGCWGEAPAERLWSRPLTSDSIATCICAVAATVFTQTDISTLVLTKTHILNLELHVNLMRNPLASISRNTCLFILSKQKQYESLT